MIPRRFFWLFDLITLSLAFPAAYWLVPRLQLLLVPTGFLQLSWVQALSPPSDWTGQLLPVADLLWILLIMAPATLLFLGVFGNYDQLRSQSYTRLLVGSFLAPFVGLSLVTLVSFALKAPGWSRLFSFLYAALGGLGLSSYRIFLRLYFLRRHAAGYYARNVVLIGRLPAVESVARLSSMGLSGGDYRLLGYLPVSSDQSPPSPPLFTDEGQQGQTTGPAPLVALGDVRELGDLLIHRPIHEVIAIHPLTGGEWIAQVIRDCDYFGVGLRIVPEALLLQGGQSLKNLHLGGAPQLPAVVLTPPHWDSEALFFKRLFDIVVSAVLLVLLMPVFALIAIAIRITTPHLPVFYPWRVVGHLSLCRFVARACTRYSCISAKTIRQVPTRTSRSQAGS